MPLGWQGFRIHLEELWELRFDTPQCLSFLKQTVVLYSALGQTTRQWEHILERNHTKLKLHYQVLLNQGILMTWGKMLELELKIS